MSSPPFVLACLLTATCLPAFSQVDEASLVPTELESERMRGENDGENAYFIFTGSVVLTATNLTISCDELELYSKLEKADGDERNAIGDFSSIEKIVATGNVSIVQEGRNATAGRAEVRPNEEVIILSEDPIIVQGPYTFTGPELVIERGKGRVSVVGSNRNKVRLVGPPVGDLGFEDDGTTIVPEEIQRAAKPLDNLEPVPSPESLLESAAEEDTTAGDAEEADASEEPSAEAEARPEEPEPDEDDRSSSRKQRKKKPSRN